ncbi:hypothetical protein HanRHA438_Chr10g0446441 [Helianthus annuus]|nr:hypothetical protein HanRHA438_Chr10g0446441 [Helianthus annuus]
MSKYRYRPDPEFCVNLVPIPYRTDTENAKSGYRFRYRKNSGSGFRDQDWDRDVIGIGTVFYTNCSSLISIRKYFIPIVHP